MRLNIILSGILLVLFGACNSSVEIRNAEAAFDVGQYSVALAMLEEEIEKTENTALKADTSFLMGKA